MSIGSGNADIAGFERLPKRIQNTALEFWQLVEEQDAQMGKADFAGADAQAASDERGHRRAVMRRTERTAAGHSPALQFARDRRNHRDFESL